MPLFKVALAASLRALFEKRRRIVLNSFPLLDDPNRITEAQIAHLPAPVRRYLRIAGSVGRPRIQNLQLAFDAVMFRKPGAAGMPGPAEQFERFDPPRRLFFMKTRMFGLPVSVLHDYDDARANMTVRVASLFDVVDLHGDEVARTETVTLLNDLCCFAPSWFLDPRLAFQPLDDRHAEVTFTNGPHEVSAILVFDEAGYLVNFVSEDRGALQDDGTLKRFRWSTPLSEYRDFSGRRVATRGEAVWRYPEGDFVYGRFTLKDIQYDVRV